MLRELGFGFATVDGGGDGWRLRWWGFVWQRSRGLAVEVETEGDAWIVARQRARVRQRRWMEFEFRARTPVRKRLGLLVEAKSNSFNTFD